MNQESLSVIMIGQEQFCALPRTEMREAKVGRDRHLSDAWDATNWDGLCGTPRQMVGFELKSSQKVTADQEGAGLPLPGIVVEGIPEAEPRRFYVFVCAGCPGCAALASHRRAIKPDNNE